MSVAGSIAAVQPCSTWHSPVSYLFGELASMLGLVGFALLILACSYCRHSGRLANAGEDVKSGGNDGSSKKKKKMEVYKENVLVIMAGEEMPTFLATPASTKASPLGGFNDGEGSEKADSGDKVKEEI
ncbi:glutamine dumper 2 [Hibiscus trionum]|uniref:Glutamine dumper 2 n=1 Tax=Hibiscus trionum TaxID=183268 RepID=A0A9W7HN60_HIBTR|nr:glutamine dumper 2 [Hibiscus trionum]